MNFLQTLKYLKSRRPGICPNLGFELQLKTYEKARFSPQNTFLLATKKRQLGSHIPDSIKSTPLPDIMKSSPYPLHTTSYNKSFRN